jgi:hypothetical protein
MRRFVIAVSSMSATYTVGEFYAETLDDAIQQARRQVMPDMRGWRFYEIDD